MTHNWTYKKLGEMVNIRTGKLDANAANEGGKYPFFTCSREPLRIDTYSYDCECVLVAGNGELNVKYYKGKFDAYQRTYIIEKKPEVDYISTYYIYLFFQKYIDVLRKGSIGGIIKYIKLGDLTNAIIPIPSLDEQQAIVRELDAINRLIDLQEEQLREYDRLAQSLFYTTFGDPVSNPKGWEVKKLGEICVNITDGDHMPPPKTENGIPFITISNVDKEQNRISFENTFFVSSEYYESIKKEKRAQIGDVLYTVTGSYGIPIVVDFNRRFCFQRHIGLIRPVKEQLLPRYLACWLKSEDGMRQADMKATGIAQKTVSLASLKGFNIPLPPLALQQSFAAQIEAIEQQKTLIRRSLDETRTLLAARMQYYFE